MTVKTTQAEIRILKYPRRAFLSALLLVIPLVAVVSGKAHAAAGCSPVADTVNAGHETAPALPGPPVENMVLIGLIGLALCRNYNKTVQLRRVRIHRSGVCRSAENTDRLQGYR